MERFPCSQQENCRLRESRMGCREDVHHLYYPANQYKKGIAKVFRELEENKVITCRELHEEAHAAGSPPDMPSIETMQEAIQRSRENRQDVA